MDQKATSVADVSFVLDWISSGPSPLEKMIQMETQKLARHKEKKGRARRRINAVIKEMDSVGRQMDEMAQVVFRGVNRLDSTKLPVSFTTLANISREHHGIIRLASESTGQHLKGSKIPEFEEHTGLEEAKEEWDSFNPVDYKSVEPEHHHKRQTVAKSAEYRALKEWFAENATPTNETTSVWTAVKEAREAALKDFDSSSQSKQTETIEAATASKPSWSDNWDIKVLWTDPNDGLAAANWPTTVEHGVLAPYNAARIQSPRDEEGTARLINKSVHVISSSVNSQWIPLEMLNGGRSPKPKPDVEETGEERRPEFAAHTMARNDVSFMSEADAPKLGAWERVKALFGR
jgi:hypothetical protein